MKRMLTLTASAGFFCLAACEDMAVEKFKAKHRQRALSLPRPPFPELPPKDLGKPGYARFEVLGMMKEYICRPLNTGNTNIEHFYCGESDKASHFKMLLNEFCQEEGIPNDIKMTMEECSGEGDETQTDFCSANVVRLIDAFYTVNPENWRVEFAGELSPKIIDQASEIDLLRFISGAYRRMGVDDRSPRFYGVNNADRLCVIRKALQRLGCTEFKTYCTVDLIPCTSVLDFVPTRKITDQLKLKTRTPKKLDKHYQPHEF